MEILLVIWNGKLLEGVGDQLARPADPPGLPARGVPPPLPIASMPGHSTSMQSP